MRWLYLLLFACVTTAQAQQSDADTALPDYLRDLPHYSLPGIPDSHLLPDSTHDFLHTPPQREHYFLHKPDPKGGYLPGEYKMWLNVYYKSLRQFKKDSIEFLQYKHRRDSLEHLLDSLRRMSIPVLVYRVKPADYIILNEAARPHRPVHPTKPGSEFYTSDLFKESS